MKWREKGVSSNLTEREEDIYKDGRSAGFSIGFVVGIGLAVLGIVCSWF